jgi:DNA-directed RNA polymerase specialized sigma24 family protein
MALDRLSSSHHCMAQLWTVFHHHIIAWRKCQHRSLPFAVENLEELAAPDSVQEASAEEYRRALLGQALKLIERDFPAQTWQIFWAVAIEGQAGIAVAKRFNVTPNAVYLARGRVLARLREELTGLEN